METTLAATAFGVCGLALLVFVGIKRRAVLKCIKTLRRDWRGILRFIKTFRSIKQIERARLGIADVFDKTVRENPEKIFFKDEFHDWTFLEVWTLSNQVGHYYRREGYQRGDVVALYMENRPEFVAIWLGLSRLGVVTALINSNLRSHTLAHSIDIANVRGIIYGKELSQAIFDLMQTNSIVIKEGMQLFAVGYLKNLDKQEADTELLTNVVDLDTALQQVNGSQPVLMTDKPKFHDSLMYIYTSGTTGLPKAAIVTTARFVMGSVAFHSMNALTSSDILYTCLPLYHTAGGMCGVGQGIFYGNTIVLRKKFSASKFWKDCADNNVTVAQYIGELCRYLLNQPESQYETSHQIKRMIGNGLRPEIWEEFMSRFKIPSISEVYGSTDGNCNFVNFDNRVGAVGFIPIWAAKVFPAGVIQVDPVTGEALRDFKTGLVLRCRPGQAGECVGKIVKNHAVRDFQGYAGKDSGGTTEKKILRNVFAKGDAYFRTGDILVIDEYGYLYFKDRAGDSFRWKGENVACAEVEGIISKICGFQDSVVFGVQIPFADGKAGMAVIADPNKDFQLDKFGKNINETLPSYARPVFLRITDCIETTSTHKMKKVELQEQGLDISRTSDAIYVYQKNEYIPLNALLLAEILNGKIRL